MSCSTFKSNKKVGSLIQTFLPYPNFASSAKSLDLKRLSNQRNEALIILKSLCGATRSWKNPNAWKNHPAVLMWKGHQFALYLYGMAICYEWQQRTGKPEFVAAQLTGAYRAGAYGPHDVVESFGYPPWVGNEAFHASHRSNLLRKDPVWYSRFDWKESNNLPYIWPSGVMV